jgi:hypothetical protein
MMKKTAFHKYIYIGFILVGCVYLFQKSIGQAIIYLGLALAFDPFKQEENWNERPGWQKLVLLIHLSIVFGLVFIEIFNLFKK